MSEQDVLGIIAKISKSLSYKFRFGFYDNLDIEQESFILAMDALDRYDGKRPLENFLRVHIKNRLCNYKRDNFQRTYELKCKCKLCKKKVDHEVRLKCNSYKQWYFRNLEKKNILLPLSLDHEKICENNERNLSKSDDLLESLSQKEIFNIIDQKLPVSMRVDYIKMKNGIKLSKQREQEILTQIRKILNGKG